ncbi:carbohydrate ABC transporter permease [Neorhizobium galegae]|uniref:carbohydrate ABC transporter permease n=2 Tax=Neorhizobium galegae TaxID=399 RepID=UPI00127D1560|nr:carbohydrate ABC transporter permease [Neorhizobium galegae]KAA9383923.1 carbohydrate ABC transporter permease [Neorhizobium galegae]KAB1115133.1 carbohydrate ABC transporter permease [Neorhizobium galegae]
MMMSAIESRRAMPVAAPSTSRLGGRLKRIALHGAVLLLCVVWFTPVLSLFVTTFRSESDSSLTGWWHAFVEWRPVLSNYVEAIYLAGVGRSVVNSIVLTIPTVLGTVLFSAIGAFALARMRFRGRIAVFLAMVGFQVLPPQLVLVPMLKFFLALGLTGTFIPVWIIEMGLTVPFGIFLLYGFFASIPSDLIEAARIDGASEPRIFFQIILPLSGAVLASLAILQFMIAWNHLLIPLIFLGSGSLSPLTVQVASLAQTNAGGLNTLTAATFISVVVPLVLIVSLQKYFVRGVLGGAVKG